MTYTAHDCWLFAAGWAGAMTFRLNPIPQSVITLLLLKKCISNITQEYPFEYHFVDENFERKFQEENNSAHWLIGLVAWQFLFPA